MNDLARTACLHLIMKQGRQIKFVVLIIQANNLMQEKQVEVTKRKKNSFHQIPRIWIDHCMCCD